MKKTAKKLLEDNGWIIECESPLEISLKEDPESRATGQAATLIACFLETLEWIECKKSRR